LVIAPKVLRPGQIYKFALKVYLPDNPSKFTTSTVTVPINQIPFGGTCSISPNTGDLIALQTQFTISCANWQNQPENLPHMYQFQVVDPVTQLSRQILQDFQQAPQLTCVLPAGNPVPLRVVIRDKWGGTEYVSLQIAVKNPDISSPAKVNEVATQALSQLSAATSYGDLNLASQVVGPLAIMLDATSNQTANAANPNEVQQQRTEVWFYSATGFWLNLNSRFHDLSCLSTFSPDSITTVQQCLGNC
jgi:hypothetical protein